MPKSPQKSPLSIVLIYRVEFNDRSNELGANQYYFTSLSAIYDKFTPEQIGCRLENLYNLKISDGSVYFGRNCTIRRCIAYRKARVSARVAKKPKGGTTAHPKQNDATRRKFKKNNDIRE